MAWPPVTHKDVQDEITALRAALVPYPPAAATYTYDEDGNIDTETVGGVATTYTYNPDGTVATSQRGDGPVWIYTYSGGVLVGVA
jgi:YD repeat-containing protein